MSILIGRTPHGQQPQEITRKSVSKRHAVLTQLGKDRWMLEDQGSSFGTFVNGLPVVSTEVGLDTPILLADFATTVRELLCMSPAVAQPPKTANNNHNANPGNPPQTVTVSVKHLHYVYEQYNEGLKNLQKKKAKAQIMRMLPMQLLMPLTLGLSGILISNDEMGSIIKGVIMVVIMGLTSLMSLRMFGVSNRHIDEQSELTKRFQIDFVCPHCKNFFGPQKPYEALLNQGKCQYCKAEFKESKQMRY